MPLSAFLIEGVAVVEAFIWTKNILALTAIIPFHLILYLLVRKEIRTLELVNLWAQTKAYSYFECWNFWKVSTRSPLRLNINRSRKYHKQALKNL